MSSLAEVDEEHTVVKLILASFVDYEDAETDRKTHLKSLFGKHESVKVYYGYSQMQLQETESKLREEKLILLRSRNSSIAPDDSPGVATLVRQLETTSLGPLQQTPLNQGSASVFANKPAEGLGYLPTFVRFVPETGPVKLVDIFVPTSEDVCNAPRLRLYGEKLGLMTWGETEARGITSQLSNALSSVPFLGIHANGQKTFTTRNLGTGIAEGRSYNDFHNSIGDSDSAVYTGVLENKGAEGSILGAVSQAVASSTNMQISLLQRGLPRERCVIPVVGNTGLCMVFGVSIVLYPSFPTFIPLSKRLDLSDPYERKVAAAYLKKANDWAQALGKEVLNLPSAHIGAALPATIALDTSAYFVKVINADVYERGFGLFSDDAHHLCIQSGLVHMVEALNRLYESSSARQYVEFPLAVRTPDSGKGGCDKYEVIYRNLVRLGFRTGAPHRIHHPKQYDSFVEVLKKAVAAVWEAGVIHGDMYISNVMYKVSECGAVDIKIVDWDAAHCIDEGDFSEKAKARLSDFFEDPEAVSFSKRHDESFVEALAQDITMVVDEEIWNDLASDDKKKMDSAFKALLFSYIKK